MKLASFLLLCAGTALFVALIADQGFANVFDASIAAGWGILAVTAIHLVALVSDTMAWRVMMPGAARMSVPATLRIRWIGEAVNSLLPAAPLGGDFVRTRLAILKGMPAASAGASVLADLTFGALSQVVFSLMGVVALLHLGVSFGDPIVAAVTIGPVVVGGLLGLFLALQNRGMFQRLARLITRAVRGRILLDLVGGAEALDSELNALYARGRTILWSLAWRLAGWLTGVVEIWLAMIFLDHPLGWIEAIMIESVIQVIRVAGFAVPGVIGVQEGGFILLGSFVGIGPDIALALALIRRARELLFSVPAMIAWQIQEGSRVFRRDRG